MIGILIRRGTLDSDKEKSCDWGSTSTSQSTPESTPKPSEAGGGLEQTLPHSPQREPALPVLGSQTPSLQNCGARNPCCQHHPLVVLCYASAGMVAKRPSVSHRSAVGVSHNCPLWEGSSRTAHHPGEECCIRYWGDWTLLLPCLVKYREKESFYRK